MPHGIRNCDGSGAGHANAAVDQYLAALFAGGINPMADFAETRAQAVNPIVGDTLKPKWVN